MTFPDLPITPYLEQICSSLKNSDSHFLILTAETAAGKSTLVAPALLEYFSKKILMLEPRRLAVLSIANRISELFNEETGNTVGYTMHLDSKKNKNTRIEILTEAILTRRLQNDPSLEDTNVVIIDEFHERSIHSDLALAFLKEAMALRDDLFVIVMSATIETKKLSEYLGSKDKPTPILKIPGRQFPVSIEYAGQIPITKAITNQLNKEKDSTILVFLPGIAEIRRCQSELSEYGLPDEDTEVLLLHSSISFSEQKKVLSPQKKGINRIILSSTIAETSLTVPGVKTVIDSGLSRINKMNISLGMESLETEKESIFSAEQRAGRAGRLGPGKCIRLWNKNDVLLENTQAEILRTDITNLVLECAQWGIQDLSKIDWLDKPNQGAWNEAVKLLQKLGFLNAENFITEYGKAGLKLGLHPRLAKTALCGYPELALEYSNYSKISPEIQKKFLTDLINRLNNIPDSAKTKESSKATALLAGFPDRLAKNTEVKGLYQFPNGRIAHLEKQIIETNALLPKWIIATEINAGEKEGCIHSFMPLAEMEALEWLTNHTKTITELSFENNKILKEEQIVYGKIILSRKKLPSSPEDFANAICVQVQKKGFDSLPINDEIKTLLLRSAFFSQQNNTENKSSKDYLQTTVNDWLLPFLAGKTNIQSSTVYEALYWFLNGNTLDKEVPLQITLPNGKKRKISYEWQTLKEENNKKVIRPVLEIIIQQIFACFETPKILGMPVLLKLLSPARRPLQITDDLANFWTSTWPEICKEMKGRYPKHNWDYKTAEKE